MSREKTTITEDQLHAYVDGHLNDSEKVKVERYLQDNPLAAERVAAYQIQNEFLHQLFDPALEAENNVLPIKPTIERKPNHWLSLAAGISLFALGGLAGWLGKETLTSEQFAPQFLAQSAGAAHVVYAAEIVHPVEVTSENEKHLAAWLSKRLSADVKPPHLDEIGFSLMGGRLLPTESGPAAQFMYENATGLRITLYIRTDIPNNQSTSFRFYATDNVNVFYWVDGAIGYALSGKLDRAQLLPIAQLLYHQL